MLPQMKTRASLKRFVTDFESNKPLLTHRYTIPRCSANQPSETTGPSFKDISPKWTL